MLSRGRSLIAVALALAPTACNALVVPPGAPQLFFSEQNWARNATTAVSVNSGSYFKMSFTGTVDAPVLRLRPNNASAQGDHYMNIVFSIDDWEFVELAVLSNTTELVLHPTRPLAEGDVHNLTVMIYNSKQSANRWSAPTAPGGAALVLLGVDLGSSAGATAIARADISPNRCVFFGDSITEGVASQCHPDPSCTEQGDLCSNSATKTWGRAVAAAMECEYSQIGFGGLGWSVPGGGGVVPLFTPGNPAESSWNQIFAGAPRTFAGIDFVFVLHATNDGLRAKGTPGSVAAVTSSVAGWLGAIRAAVGNQTEVFLTVPFGSFGAAQDPIGALKAGFDRYQSAASSTDTKTHYVDLGPTAARGLTHFGIHSVEGCGGIHPRGGTSYSARHGELGAMIARQATRATLSCKQAGSTPAKPNRAKTSHTTDNDLKAALLAAGPTFRELNRQHFDDMEPGFSAAQDEAGGKEVAAARLSQ